MNGESIIKTLVELLEAQEEIKITYETCQKEEATNEEIQN